MSLAVTDDYIGIDDFIDRTHKQISRSRHFYRTSDDSFREFHSTVPICVAGPIRPYGSDGGHEARASVGVVGPLTIH